jgi:hypothetical protein
MYPKTDLSGRYVDENGVICLDEFTKKMIKRKLRGLEDKEISGVKGEYSSLRFRR